MQYKLLIEELEQKGVEIAAIVGHEPDLSSFISFYLSETNLSLQLKRVLFAILKIKYFAILYSQIFYNSLCIKDFYLIR